MVIPPVAELVAAAKAKATRVVWGVGQNKVKLDAAVNEWNTKTGRAAVQPSTV
jgi:hypothetical protein